MSSFVVALLLVVHVILTGWGALGLLEYATGVSVIALQNPAFPAGVQVLHFLGIFAAGGVFLAGYAMRWRATPFAMTIIYAGLAMLCAVETLDYLTGSGRFLLFALEVASYVAISTYLLNARRMRHHFDRA